MPAPSVLAFAANGVWSAAAARSGLARRTASPAKTTVVLRPAQKRRVRVAHQQQQQQGKPARRPVVQPAPRAKPTEKKGRHSAKQARVASGELLQKDVHMDMEDRFVADVKGEHAVKENQVTEEAGVDVSVRDAKQQEKERMQKAYLNDQLAKRQELNQSKKQRKHRPSKRVRPVTPSSISMRNATVLKDTFQAYMDDISREDLLDQAEVISLATHINLGVAVEEAQRSMEKTLGRRPSIAQLAENLGIGLQEVQKRRMAGTAAKNQLVAANLRLVTSIARKVASTKSASTAGIALDDMVQEGSVGLIRAAEKFDASRGYKFSTYATWWIRAFVMRSITTQSRSIKVPSTVVDEYARIRKQYSAMRENGVFKPTEEEVAHGLGITAAKLRFVVKVVTQVPTSLDIGLDPGSDASNSRTLGEIVEGQDNVEESMVEDLQRRELDAALRGCLRPLERAVVRLRFGLDDGQPRTLRETGDLLGLSKERIRQLLFRALPKMKTPEIQQMLIDATTR